MSESFSCEKTCRDVKIRSTALLGILGTCGKGLIHSPGQSPPDLVWLGLNLEAMILSSDSHTSPWIRNPRGRCAKCRFPGPPPKILIHEISFGTEGICLLKQVHQEIQLRCSTDHILRNTDFGTAFLPSVSPIMQKGFAIIWAHWSIQLTIQDKT